MEMKFDINEVVRNLKKKDYTVHYFKTHEEAAEYIAGQIDGKKVGFGDSKTLLGMGMVEKLKENPANEVHHPDYPPEGMGFNDEARVCLTAEVFLSSVNAMTKDGMLVNIDSTGNRVAGTLFGPLKNGRTNSPDLCYNISHEKEWNIITGLFPSLADGNRLLFKRSI